MMKKTISILCVVLMSVFFTACNGAGNIQSSETVSITSPVEESVQAKTESTEINSVSSASEFNLEKGTVILNEGIEMPILGIGTFALSDKEAEESVYWALRD